MVASLIEEALPRLARSSKAVTARSDLDADLTLKHSSWMCASTLQNVNPAILPLLWVCL